MKRIFILLLFVSICFPSFAQFGGMFHQGHAGQMIISTPETPQEYIQAYYYDESNTIKICRVLLCRDCYFNGDGRASIWVCDDDDVEIDSEGRFHLHGGYGVSNISRCNKKEPINELEQRFSYKYLDKGIWYYFNSGLDLFIKPEKKSLKEKIKELLFE